MGTDVPSLHTFLEILSRNGPEYDSNDIDCYSLSCECFHIDGEILIDEAPKLTSLDLSPCSHAKYLHEKAMCLQDQQADLEAIKAELEWQREELTRQQATQVANDDDGRMGAPSMLHFPRAAYNMVDVAYRLEDISDTQDLKTNERLHKAKQLRRVALDQ